MRFPHNISSFSVVKIKVLRLPQNQGSVIVLNSMTSFSFSINSSRTNSKIVLYYVKSKYIVW